MTGFALQIDLTGGGVLHMFGRGPDAYDGFVKIRDGWQDRHPDDYYTFREPGGRRDVFVRDILDVRVVEGGTR